MQEKKKPIGPSAVNSCFCLDNDPLISRILLCHLFLLPLGPFLFFGIGSFVLPFLLLFGPPLIHFLFRIVESVLIALPSSPVVILLWHWSPAAKKLQKRRVLPPVGKLLWQEMWCRNIGFKECQWHSLAQPLVQPGLGLSCWTEGQDHLFACNPLPCDHQDKCSPRRSSINCWWLAFPWELLEELYQMPGCELGTKQVGMQGLKRSWQPVHISCPTCFKLIKLQTGWNKKQSCCPWKADLALQLPLNWLQACCQERWRTLSWQESFTLKGPGSKLEPTKCTKQSPVLGAIFGFATFIDSSVGEFLQQETKNRI